MDAANWIALAGVAATAVVGVTGLVVNRRTQESERESREREADAQREHALQLSRGDRYFVARLDAYREAARMLERVRLFVMRRNPIMVIGEPVPPPPNFDDAEWEALRARIVVASSREVLDAIDVGGGAFQTFQAHAMTYEALDAQHADPIQVTESRQAMDESRRPAYDALDAAQQVMRDELAAL